MSPDQERWAEALAIETLHGDRAPVGVNTRFGALERAGDTAGAKRFAEIATS